MTTFNISSQAKPFSDLNFQFGLIENVELGLTVPGNRSDYFVCEFSWDRNYSIWVGYNIDLETPSSDLIIQRNRIEQNPFFKFVRGGDFLNFQSNTNISDVGVSLYILNSNKFFPVNPIPPTENIMLYEDETQMIYEDGTIMDYE